MKNLDQKTFANVMKENRQVMNNLNGIEFLFQSISTHINSSIEAANLKLILDLTNTLVHENPVADKTPEEHISFIFELLKLPIVHENSTLITPLLSIL